MVGVLVLALLSAPGPVRGFDDPGPSQPPSPSPSKPGRFSEEVLKEDTAACRGWKASAEWTSCGDQLLREDAWTTVRYGTEADTIINDAWERAGRRPPWLRQAMIPEQAEPAPADCVGVLQHPLSPEDELNAKCTIHRLVKDVLAWTKGGRSFAADAVAGYLKGALPAEVVEADSWTIAGLPKGPVVVGKLRVEIGETVVARIDDDEKSVGVGIAYMVEQTGQKARPIPDGVVYLLDHRRVRHAQDRLSGLFQRFGAGEHLLEPIHAGERLERAVVVKLPVEVVGRTFSLVMSDRATGAVVTLPVTLAPTPTKDQE